MAKLGVIADDFTGAGDIASFLTAGGMRTILITQFQQSSHLQLHAADCDAIVIALKSRTEPVSKAVKDSIAALHWLQDHACHRFYFKYCSTFDSTEKGNIGPVADALMDALQVKQSILCPALPVNGRTVREGKLYVNGQLLEKSPMKDHPLTPMRNSDLVNLMAAQSRYSVRKIGKVQDGWHDCVTVKQREYLVPDCETENDLATIAKIFGHIPLLTGGSGLAYYLAKEYDSAEISHETMTWQHEEGTAFLLAGSCNARTIEQIQMFHRHGGNIVALPVQSIINGTFDFDGFTKKIRPLLEKQDLLIYSSGKPEQIAAWQQMDPCVSDKIEYVMGRLAQYAVSFGCQKIIVAGGETSGSVTKALGVKAALVGPSIAPGVPVMQDVYSSLKLVLKSGNFGQPDFFERAIQAL